MTAAQQAARDAERRFPVRIRIGIPPEGFGNRLDQMSHGSTRIAVPMGGPQRHRVHEAA
jgi:hypothetical protein